MSNQTENKMNILSDACAEPIIDGIYSFCESKETITDLYTVLHTLYENGQSSETYQILRALCAVLLISDCQDLPPLAENVMPIFIQNFVRSQCGGAGWFLLGLYRGTKHIVAPISRGQSLGSLLGANDDGVLSVSHL